MGDRRRGFTLVELLVTLAVIAVLAVVITPAIQRGIDRARSTGCLAKLHQIYLGLQQYTSDNSQHLPVMLPMRASSSDAGPTLDTALSAYITDQQVFHCPADNKIFAQSGCSYLWVYGYSVDAEGQPNSSMIAPRFPLLQQTELSQIPFVSDKESFHKTSPASHVVYGDGHVE